MFSVAECSFFIRLFGRESRDLIQLNDAGSQGFLTIAKLLSAVFFSLRTEMVEIIDRR
jgi:hypothetical protein